MYMPPYFTIQILYHFHLIRTESKMEVEKMNTEINKKMSKGSKCRMIQLHERFSNSLSTINPPISKNVGKQIKMQQIDIW